MLKSKSKSLFKSISQIRWMSGLLYDFKLRMAGYAILILIKTLIDLGLTYAVGNLVQYIVSDDLSSLKGYAIAFVGVFAVKLIITFIAQRVSVFNYSDMHKSLLIRLYDKTLYADWESLEEHDSGDLLTRLSKDVKTVAGNMNGLVPTIVSNMLSILAAFAVVVYFDYTVLIVFALAAPVVIFSTKLFGGKVLDYQRKGREAESEIMLLNKETFHNMQSVKAFSLFKVFHIKMEERAEKLRQCDRKSNFMYMISWVITQVLGLIAILICGAWMVYRVHTGVITFGNITSMAALGVSAASALSKLFGLMPTIAECIASLERIREIVEIEDEPDLNLSTDSQKRLTIHLDSKMEMILENICFHYHTGPNIFENVDLKAKSGEIVALVGPSGEGKTTMLRLILGIVRIQTGSAILRWDDGESVNFGTMTRSLIAYVPQGNTMMAGSIADNMRLIAPDATDEDIVAALEMACAYDFVKKLPDGLNHKIGEGGLGFSEGQNQRLAIARAILRNAPILLLDEATSALDVATERNVLRNIMQNSEQRICLLTTHRPSALAMCNRVYRIADRKIRTIGETEIQKLINEF